jgi:hypothetical protein
LAPEKKLKKVLKWFDTRIGSMYISGSCNELVVSNPLVSLGGKRFFGFSKDVVDGLRFIGL